MTVIESLLAKLRRQPGDLEALRSPRRTRLRSLTFAVFVSSAIALAGTFLITENRQWQSIRVGVPLPPESWHVLFSEQDCAANAEQCPADPKANDLWKSPLDRGSANYRDLLHARKAAPTWVGIHVTPEQLAAAQKGGSEILFLGRIYAPHSIWINGQRVSAVTRILSRPISLNLRSSDWANQDGAFVAIRFENTNSYHIPELTSFELGEIGLIKPAEQAALYSLIAMTDWARPLAFGLANILIAIAFFIFWRTEPVKQEYLFFSCYALIQGVTQILMIPDLVIWAGAWRTPIAMNLEVWETTFPLILGLSFLRAGFRPLSYLLGLVLFGSLLCLLNIHGAINPHIFESLSDIYWAPLCSMTASSLCLAEFAFSENLPEKRQYRLLGFSGALAATGALYAIFGHDAASYTTVAIWQHLAHLVLTSLMGGLIFSDFHEMAKNVRMTSLSQFHLNEKFLNKPVLGTLLFFDLKKSEQILMQGHSEVSSSEALSRAMYPFRLAWLQKGGIEITGDGDGVKVFFPAVKTTPESLVTNLIPEMTKIAEAVTEILKADRISPPEWQTHFRAALSYGAIIPVLKRLGMKENAEWQDGVDQPFVTTARLIDIEKEKLDVTKRCTSVLYSEFFAKALPAQLHRFLGDKAEHAGKHDRRWTFYSVQINSNRIDKAA
ncbi:MAG: hypothetical protein P4M08_03915 [Oligoflexia bacterium]|nr:hypothetical protein [Oligoflexia bacterium]